MHVMSYNYTVYSMQFTIVLMHKLTKIIVFSVHTTCTYYSYIVDLQASQLVCPYYHNGCYYRALIILMILNQQGQVYHL